jgi:ABC-type antimicrobial peptide transport system permease subunit
MALGETAAQVIANLVRRGLRPVLVGSALGVGAAMGLGPFLEDLLFRVPARDPFSAAAGVALVVAAAALGGVLPARRAAHVDPAITLRAE